ncbi:MAG: Manganese/iron superoxide dismutase-like protein [Parcubacteria group bacterium GW2011_GWF2_39_8b]|nr:MAG: Manganese/iron superoxide dismutase-like protein [Parcubacteria group bacterium GW2011_GWF2_39_8b]KKR46181.1 MAG: Manganese/iron superoxide dismutase-like protein [Parcubacteria group bacterium GW2011_GWA2_40_14]
MQFEEKKFNIPELKGVSSKTIEEHLKLYAGYVKHTNFALEKIDEFTKSGQTDTYIIIINETQRRFGFEYDGMRNHEVYFDSLSDGPSPISPDGELYKSIVYLWGSFDTWLARFKSIAMTRGVGWAMLYLDTKEHRLLNAYIEDHQLGQLVGCTPILALDMWEHAFVADYQPSGKKQYVEDFFANLNWKKVEENFNSVAK